MRNKYDPSTVTIQRYLCWLGLYRSSIDGIWGQHTETALEDFMAHEGYAGDVIQKLHNKVNNFSVNAWDNPEGLARAVYDLCHQMYHGNVDFPAYIMATIQHETGGTYRPVEESFYLPPDKLKTFREMVRYRPYWGRGYVQLTWDYNYVKYGKILGINLVGNPDLAKDPLLSLFITVHGMLTGTFTGKAMSNYYKNGKLDSIQVRRTVNGVRKGAILPDKAELIQRYYYKWRDWYASNY